jgi:hypothetical protein
MEIFIYYVVITIYRRETKKKKKTGENSEHELMFSPIAQPRRANSLDLVCGDLATNAREARSK